MITEQDRITTIGLSKSIIVVDKLSKTFSDGKIRAVDGIIFEVREGEIFGFLRPKAQEKPTTINILTALLKPTS